MQRHYVLGRVVAETLNLNSLSCIRACLSPEVDQGAQTDYE